MTRINLIPPEDLVPRHLLAEYMELPRVFGLVRKAQDRGLTPDRLVRPPTYRLGEGHVKFFYDKLEFLVKRQQSLVDEIRRRGYRPRFVDPSELLSGIAPCWINDYEPTPLEIQRSARRINESLKRMKGES